jgi:hypothetical protein
LSSWPRFTGFKAQEFKSHLQHTGPEKQILRSE